MPCAATGSNPISLSCHFFGLLAYSGYGTFCSTTVSSRVPNVVSLIQVSATLLGEPDVGLLTPPEMARKTSQICMSIPQVPVIVDADTGKLLNMSFPQVLADSTNKVR